MPDVCHICHKLDLRTTSQIAGNGQTQQLMKVVPTQDIAIANVGNLTDAPSSPNVAVTFDDTDKEARQPEQGTPCKLVEPEIPRGQRRHTPEVSQQSINHCQNLRAI